MNKRLYFAVFMIILISEMCFLYRQGFVMSRHIKAGRFRESRTYNFCFDAQLSKGDARVLILIQLPCML